MRPLKNAPRLGCVAVPIIAGDIAGNLRELFTLWADQRFFPGEDMRPHLMVVVNRASDAELGLIESLYKGFPGLAACFSGFSAHSAGLDGERDAYAPDGGAQGPAFGRKAGPNFLFQRVIELAGAHGGFTLQLELDCLPVGPGWLDRVGQVIDDHPRAWVIGSHYAGAGLLGADAKTHFNGNALYHVGNPHFRAFFDDIWVPRLLHQIAARPDLAYDWWWSVERHEADARANNQSWQLFQRYDSFFQADPYVVNLAVPEGEMQAYAQVYDRFAGLGQPPVFLHGPAMTSLRRAVLQQPTRDIFETIDRLDPPKTPITARRPARVPPQSATPTPDQILLQAAADLLNPARREAVLSPERAQMISDAREMLAKDHPARAHFDQVRAHAGT